MPEPTPIALCSPTQKKQRKFYKRVYIGSLKSGTNPDCPLFSYPEEAKKILGAYIFDHLSRNQFHD